MNPDDLDRRPGETPTAHMLRGIIAAIATGLDEAGLPLTDEQVAFLANAADSVPAGVDA
jgi:hypothetical protein